MLIGIDAHQANKKHRTGTEWYSVLLIQALARLSTSSRFVLYAPTPLVADLRALGPSVTERVLAWPPRRGWTHARLSLELLRHPPDALFVPAHTVPLLHPSATVTMVHDVGFLDLPSVYSRWERWYNTRSLRWSVRAARHVLVPSAFTKVRLLAHCSLPEHRVTIIHHGFSPEPYRTGTDAAIRAALARYGIAQPYVLTVGRVEEKKNAPRLLEAFGRMLRASPSSNLSLVFAGRDGYGAAALAGRVEADRVLKHRVRFLGYVSAGDLPALLAGARIFAFPTLYEGFGFPLLEAQACGVPALASSNAALPEIGGGGALYVDPFSVSALADGLRALDGDERLRARLRERGTANIQRFSWERCARETLAALEDAQEPR